MTRPVIATAATWCVMVAVAADPPRGLTTDPWQLEVLELRDGRRLEGVIETPAPDRPLDGEDCRFMQVVRRPGRPMYVITWPPLSADRIRTVDRLPVDDHRRLLERVRSFLDGRQRRLDAETAVKLVRDDENGPWRYVGEEFDLESGTDAAITRGAVVALEQVLQGLAVLVPASRPDARRTIHVRICGSAAEYRDVQRSLGIAIDNPAFYLPARGLLVAGGDLATIVEQSRAADDVLAATAQRYAELDRLMPARLQQLAADLESRGIPAASRADTIQRARQRWERERAGARERLAAASRENATRADQARQAFRGRLAHEAWHAYADTRLRAHRDAPLPTWIDEGLAQVVESAPLEAGELRLDAPDPRRLGLLQQALRAGRVPPVADLVRAGQAAFLAGHAAVDETGVAYLAAWGLALDVAMLRPVLSPTTIEALASDDDGDPVADFELLTGLAVDRYEAEWKRRILTLEPGKPLPRGLRSAP